ncbi:MAG: hypothetical protein ABJA61_02450 [Caldimonas sp.]
MTTIAVRERVLSTKLRTLRTAIRVSTTELDGLMVDVALDANRKEFVRLAREEAGSVAKAIETYRDALSRVTGTSDGTPSKVRN